MQEFLTTDELAERLAVSPRWVQARVADGTIPHYRLPPGFRAIRYRPSEVGAWLGAFKRGGRRPLGIVH